ncbi:hypothetical protein JEQ12_003429, partial [Ovis aries]
MHCWLELSYADRVFCKSFPDLCRSFPPECIAFISFFQTGNHLLTLRALGLLGGLALPWLALRVVSYLHISILNEPTSCIKSIHQLIKLKSKKKTSITWSECTEFLLFQRRVSRLTVYTQSIFCYTLLNLFIYRVQMKEFQDQKNKKANYYGPDQIRYEDQ